MKKIFVSVAALFLVACGLGSGVASQIMGAVSEQKSSININEVTDYEWEGLTILRPYQQKTILGEKFNNEADTDCIWVFHDGTTVVDAFSIARETVDCIKLPVKVFGPLDAIFLIEKNILKERKRFQLPDKR